MDGENHGKAYFLMDDLGGKPTIFGNIHFRGLHTSHQLDDPLTSLLSVLAGGTSAKAAGQQWWCAHCDIAGIGGPNNNFFRSRRVPWRFLRKVQKCVLVVFVGCLFQDFEPSFWQNIRAKSQRSVAIFKI